MSDIDSDYDNPTDNLYQYDGSIGTPPISTHLSLPPTIHANENNRHSTVTNIRTNEYQHRRSVSDHTFSNNFHWHRHRFKENGTTSTNGKMEEGASGMISESILTDWERSVDPSDMNYFSDFAPFERGLSTEEPQTTNQFGYIPTKQGNFKQALKRTVKRVISTKSELDINGIAEEFNSENEASGRRKRKWSFSRPHPYEEGRMKHRHSLTSGLLSEDILNEEDSNRMLVSHSHYNASEIPQSESAQKSIKNRYSITDIFNRMRKSVSMHTMYDENCSTNEAVLWSISLKVKSASILEKTNCYVQIQHNDRLIAKSKTCFDTNFPEWNQNFTFTLTQIDVPLELQLVQKHSLRSDKLIGRSYIDMEVIDLNEISLELHIKGFSAKRGGKSIGNFLVDINIESTTVDSPEDMISISSSEFGPSEESTMSGRKRFSRKNIQKKLGHHFHRYHVHRSKARSVMSNSTEILNELPNLSGEVFVFRPQDVTKWALETVGVQPTVSWKPFSEWPGTRLANGEMLALFSRQCKRFELRLPNSNWPLEFLLPMDRLSLPSTEISLLNVKDTIKPFKVIDSGILLIHLIGARGLRAMPQVKEITRDERSLKNGASAETRAASVVAFHWAAKSLTTPPSPYVIFQHGSVKQESKIVKNASNPDYLQEFIFTINNGSPRFVNISVIDQETQSGSGGIPRSHLLGTSTIDLFEIPMEMTQRVELQLLKNTNEARLLLLLTLTGLKTAIRGPFGGSFSPVNQSPQLSLTNGPSSTSIPELPSPSSADSVVTESISTNVLQLEVPSTPSVNKNQFKLPPNFNNMLADYFGYKNSFQKLQDIGWMQVKIISAMNLGGKASSSKVESYCVVDFINTRLITQSVIKTDKPMWNRSFVIPVTDIHGVLKISIYDLEKNRREIVGRIAIHLLKIHNAENTWYALKSPDLRSPTKGSILVEIILHFNQFKAALKTFTPKETRYSTLAKKQKMLQQRFEHVKPLLELIRWCGQVLDDWWLWKKPIHSIFGLIAYQLLVYYYKPYFIPGYMMLVMLKNRFSSSNVDVISRGLRSNKTVALIASPREHEFYKRQCELLDKVFQESDLRDEDDFDMDKRNYDAETAVRLSAESQDIENLNLFEYYNISNTPVDEEEKEDDKPEVKKSMKSKFNGYKESTTRILEIVENVASFYERVEGLFHWRIPWISGLAVVVLMLFTTILFFLPLKVVFMLWGLNKFTKSILRPNAVRHNEFLDFLSRVPNLIESNELAEYRPDAYTTPTGGTRAKTLRK